MKSGDTGKLFGSVTQKHIYDALVEKGINLDRKQLNLSNPIKSLGSHVLSVRLHTEVSADLVVKVAAEADENTEEPVEGEIQAETPEVAGENGENTAAETAE